MNSIHVDKFGRGASETSNLAIVLQSSVQTLFEFYLIFTWKFQYKIWILKSELFGFLAASDIVVSVKSLVTETAMIPFRYAMVLHRARVLLLEQSLTLFLPGVVKWHSYMGWFRPVLVGIGLKELVQSMMHVFVKSGLHQKSYVGPNF